MPNYRYLVYLKNKFFLFGHTKRKTLKVKCFVDLSVNQFQHSNDEFNSVRPYCLSLLD